MRSTPSYNLTTSILPLSTAESALATLVNGKFARRQVQVRGSVRKAGNLTPAEGREQRNGNDVLNGQHGGIDIRRTNGPHIADFLRAARELRALAAPVFKTHAAIIRYRWRAVLCCRCRTTPAGGTCRTATVA